MIILHASYALICSILWSISTIASKMLLGSNTPILIITFLRYTIAIVCLFPFISRAELSQVTRKQLPSLILLGFTGVLLYNVLFFSALHHTSPTIITLILATHPVLTLLVSSLTVRQMPSQYQVLAFMLSLIGAGMVITQGKLEYLSFSCNVGELLMMLGVLVQITYTMTLKKVSRLFSPQFLTFATAVSGMFFLIPLLINQNVFQNVAELSFFNWTMLGYIGVLGTAIAVVFYSLSVVHLGPAKTSLFVFSTMPIFVFILSFFILGDTISSWQAGGGLMVLCALILGLKAG